MVAQQGFRVTGLFHPTALVRDLHGLHDFYRTVFGVGSRTILFSNGVTNVYRSFTLIGDVWVENMSPEPDYFSPYRMYSDTVGNHWLFPCFYVEDMQDMMYHFHTRNRIRMNAVGTGQPLFGLPYGHPGRTNAFTNPADTGVILEYVEAEQEFHESNLGDPRQLPGWIVLPADAPENRLGIVRASHHTLATRPDATTKLRWALQDVCGAETTEPGPGHGGGVWLRIGTRERVTLELLEPSSGPAADDIARVNSCYHRLTFLVRDLAHTRGELDALGIALETDTKDLVVADPRDTHGIRFGFTDKTID